MSNPPAFKVVTIGDAQIGKSSLLFRFVHHRFPKLPNTTIGASFYCKKTSGMAINMWDTAGQERFRSMIPMYLKNVNLVLFVYDITSRSSFENLQQYWVSFVQSHYKKDEKPLTQEEPRFVENNVENSNDNSEDVYQAILIGNKIDLNDIRAVHRKEGQALADELGIPFIETSALTGKNINRLWNMIQSRLMRMEIEEPEESNGGVIVNLTKTFGDKFSGCQC